MLQKKRHKKLFGNSTTGFTLVEVLTAVLLFALVGGAALNLLFSGISAQRNSLARQLVIDQTSSVAEYMSRAIRQAQKDLIKNCLTAGNIKSYGLPGGATTLRFLDKDGLCRQFQLNSTTNTIEERRSLDDDKNNFEPAIILTSDNIEVSKLHFVLRGQSQTDDLQPRVTFSIHAKAQEGNSETFFQTTISQRHFDVQE